MTYKPHPGYVLVQVCGSPILVGTREVWESSPVVRPIPKAGEVAWTLLNAGAPWDYIRYTCAKLSHTSLEDAEEKLHALCHTLVKDGFLLEVPDEEAEHDGA